ncbi:MAG: hypothetical protein KBT27_00195 [Prevotellaceae bacterium]|nr:hypothetical protein [Candidatus Faecinaster equi]
MVKAFISHSSKQKEYATDLVEQLGRDFCIIDCYNFEPAYKTIDGEDKQMLDELLNAMQNTYSRKKEELLCAMKIEYDAYVLHLQPSDILQKIQDAEKLYPESLNIQRVVSDYKYRQAMISKEEFFDEDCDL